MSENNIDIKNSTKKIGKGVEKGAKQVVDHAKNIDWTSIHSLNYVSGLLVLLLIFICVWQIADIICKHKMEKWLRTFQYLEQISNERRL